MICKSACKCRRSSEYRLDPGADINKLAITSILTRSAIACMKLAYNAKVVFKNYSERASTMRSDAGLARALELSDLLVTVFVKAELNIKVKAKAITGAAVKKMEASIRISAARSYS